MNCIKLYKEGGYGFDHTPIVEPGADQVQIKVHSAVINPSDIICLRGKMNRPFPYPFTPGWEGSGIISKVGPDMDSE